MDTGHVGVLATEYDAHEHDFILEDLNEETLTILGHGIPAVGNRPPRVDRYDPEAFVRLLTSLGYNPANHRGESDFKSCTAGWARGGDRSFIDRVANILAPLGYRGPITGAEGFAVSIPMNALPNNAPGALDAHDIGRYEDFGIFRQRRCWSMFLEQVLIPVLSPLWEEETARREEEMEGDSMEDNDSEESDRGSEDNEIGVERYQDDSDSEERLTNLRDAMNQELQMQDRDFNQIVQTSHQRYRDGIAAVRTAIIASHQQWLQRFTEWMNEARYTDEHSPEMKHCLSYR